MKKKFAAMLVSALVVTASLAACGGSASTESTSTDTASTEEAAADTAATEEADEEVVEAEVTEDAATADAGFEEVPIFEDEELGGLINLSAVYFQAVPMDDSNGTTYAAEDADIHLEADVSALENNLGYGQGDWIPYLTIQYSVSANGEEVTSGTFMPMAASDGPHYGNNISLEPGTYDVTFTIHSPGENGYLIHSDSETGPGGLLADVFGDGPLTYTFEGWDFPGLEN